QTWMTEGKINLVAQFARQRPAELANVGSIYDLTATEAQRRILDLFLSPNRIGRALAMGPDIPDNRVKIMRAAFAKMVVDPDFLADAAKLNMSLALASGEELARLIDETFNVTAADIELAKKYHR